MDEKVAPLDAPGSKAAPVSGPHKIDGGSAAWLTTFGGFLIMFCVFGYASAFGVFQDFYTRNSVASASNISWIGSVQLFLMIATSLPAGRLVDKGYFRPLVAVGSVMYTFCLFMLSLANTKDFYQLFLAQGVGMGLFGGCLYLPAVSIQARHWKKRRALAMGIVFSGSSIGGLVFPIMLNQLLHHSTLGFQWTVRATAFLVLGLIIIANFCMTTGPPLNVPSAAATYTKLSIYKDKPYLAITFGSMLFNGGLYFPYFYIQLYAILHGVDSNFAFYELAIVNASSTIGRILPNFVADKSGPLNNYIPACLGSTVLLFALFGITSDASLIVFAILYGFFTGAVIALVAPVVATMAAHPAEIGYRMGTTFFFMSFGTLLGTPIDGVLLGSQFHWWKAIVFSGVLMASGTLLISAARFPVVKRKGSQKV
ncbi:hypothetical protein GYMLUDRAFT_85576 [Collybiopsis luxurians FD-317 M1]|uniref:Major facilitator superfamily (MFS) profile domain-containing protein n=1 Tax=Collybiopsis luxurians FD-317 M1 TaxID=944289 RepID=A0A0D0BWT1_9AGAR|nr:hypothetical protein GYMLUDRAFT_85576 [Collybiopsis luxurians FD-317 M1]